MDGFRTAFFQAQDRGFTFWWLFLPTLNDELDWSPHGDVVLHTKCWLILNSLFVVTLCVANLLLLLRRWHFTASSYFTSVVGNSDDGFW